MQDPQPLNYQVFLQLPRYSYSWQDPRPLSYQAFLQPPRYSYSFTYCLMVAKVNPAKAYLILFDIHLISIRCQHGMVCFRTYHKTEQILSNGKWNQIESNKMRWSQLAFGRTEWNLQLESNREKNKVGNRQNGSDREINRIKQTQIESNRNT